MKSRTPLLIAVVVAIVLVAWLALRPGEQESAGEERSRDQAEESLAIRDDLPGNGRVGESRTRGEERRSRERASSGEASITTADVAADNGEMPEEEEWVSRISGKVTDENDLPIGEALIMVAYANGGLSNIVATGQTDFDGNYEILNLPLSGPAGAERGLLLTCTAHQHAPVAASAALSRAAPEATVNFRMTEEGVSLTGRVIWEGEEEEPVPHADIVFYDRRGAEMNAMVGRVRADSRGHFEAHGLPRGNVSTAVAPQGRHHQTGRPHATPGEDITITLLRPNGVLSGRVLWMGSNEPVPNIEVNLGDEIIGLDAWKTFSDSEGHYEFTEIPREYWVLSSPDYPSDRPGVSLTQDPEVESDIHIIAPFDLEITAHSRASGEPVEDLEIAVTWAVGETQVTDSDGQCVFEDVQPLPAVDPRGRDLQSSLAFRILTEGWVITNQPMVSWESDPPSAFLEVSEAVPVHVTALDRHDMPIVGARLAVLQMNESVDLSSGSWHDAVSDSDGRATIWKVNSDPAYLGRRSFQGSSSGDRVYGEHPLHSFLLSEPLPRGENTVTVRPVETRDLLVRTLLDGQPVADCQVLLHSQVPHLNSLYPAPRWRSFNQNTGADGTTLFTDVPRIQYNVMAQRIMEELQAADLTSEWLVIGADSVSEEITIHLTRPDEMLVRGRVVDLRDFPIPGAAIHLTRDVALSRQSEPLGITDANGEFAFSALETVVSQGLSASAEGYVYTRMTQSLRWRDGQEEPLEFIMAPQISVRGTVLDESGDPLAQVNVMFITPSQPGNPFNWEMRHANEGGWNWRSQREPVSDAEGRFTGNLEGVSENLFLATPVRMLLGLVDARNDLIKLVDFDVLDHRPREYDVGEVRMESGHTLTFDLRDENGQPVKGYVTWECNTWLLYTEENWVDPPPRQSGGMVPDPANWKEAVSLDLLPEGTWLFQFRGENGYSALLPFEVSPTAPTRHTVELERGPEIPAHTNPFGGDDIIYL